jgi:hypothetical protein
MEKKEFYQGLVMMAFGCLVFLGWLWLAAICAGRV